MVLFACLAFFQTLKRVHLRSELWHKHGSSVAELTTTFNIIFKTCLTVTSALESKIRDRNHHIIGGLVCI